MKNKIYAFIILIVVCFNVKADYPFNTEPQSIVFAAPQEYVFTAGDTTATFNVSNARAVFFTIKDSSMSGTDSVGIWLKYTVSGSVYMYSIISVHLLATTTTTTFIASSLLIPGDATTATWVWYPGGVSGTEATYTGSFYVARLNGVNASTPYTPKTRIVVKYD